MIIMEDIILNYNLKKYQMIEIGMDNSNVISISKSNNLERDESIVQNILCEKVLCNKRKSRLPKLLRFLLVNKRRK